MYLYLASNPRALYLATSSQDDQLGRPRRVLVFRAGEQSYNQAVVEFLTKDEVDLSSAVRLTNRVVKGCLGLISIENGALDALSALLPSLTSVSDIFLVLVTSATEVGNTRPSAPSSEAVARIHEVGFYSLTSSAWDDLSLSGDMPSPDISDYSSRDSYTQTTPSSQVFEHPCMPLTKILSSGSFYYTVDSQWDLSSRLSQRLARDPTLSRDPGSFDERFVWNEYIARSLLEFRERLDPQEREDLDRCHFIVSKSAVS